MIPKRRAEGRLWVKGCPCDYIGSTSGVLQIAADLTHHPTRQHWARKRHVPTIRAQLQSV
jgi:hypothetical protein